MKKKNFRSEYFSIPNLMGYARIMLAFVYLWICVNAVSAKDYYLAGAVIAVSMITDWLDGLIARQFHMVTDWGKVLDPVSDKVTLGIVALSMLWRYPLAEWVLLLFILKEGFMLVAGLLLTKRGWRTGGALFCGKVCTASMYAVGVILLLSPELPNERVNVLLLAELVIMACTLLFYVELYVCAFLELRKGVNPCEIDLKEIQKKRKQAHRKVRGMAVIAGILLVAYSLLGILLPYAKQPEVSEKTKQEFHPEDCYAPEAAAFAAEEQPSGDDADTAGRSSARAQAGQAAFGIDRAGIIQDNGEALDTRIQMIAHAKERVILSTFDFRTDEAGLDLLSALYDAARRGVQVEIFADGFNSWLRMEGNAYFYAVSSHPNVKITLYNRMNPLVPWKSMGRMHDKYLIVDDEAFLLGGRNSFGYFLGDYAGHKNYDWDVLVYNTQNEGSDPVPRLKENNGNDRSRSSLYQVLQYYESITALDCCRTFGDREAIAKKPSVRRAAKMLEARIDGIREQKPELFEQPCAYEERTYETGRITLLSNPTGYTVKEPVVFYQLMQLAQNAKEEVWIHTPYLMCSEMMCEELTKLGSKGTMMLNSAANNGNPFGAIDYLNHKQELIDTGVQLMEYEGGISYHGKVMTVDDRLSVVGSFNMDMRSAYLDTELMLVIDSTELNRELREKMGEYEAKSALVDTVDTYRSIPEGMEMKEITFGRKCMRVLLGWLQERVRYLL